MSNRPSLDLGGPSKRPVSQPARDASAKRRRGPKLRALRLPRRVNIPGAAVMLVVLGAMLALYLPVRSAVVVPEKPLAHPAGLAAAFALPRGWGVQEQREVRGSLGRWAVKPRGSAKHALFITRYALARPAKSTEERDAVRLEAQRAMRTTGAVRIPEPQEREVDGQGGWAYAYSADGGRLSVATLLVLRENEMFQISCQAPASPESHATAFRERCEHILASWKWD